MPRTVTSNCVEDAMSRFGRRAMVSVVLLIGEMSGALFLNVRYLLLPASQPRLPSFLQDKSHWETTSSTPPACIRTTGRNECRQCGGPAKSATA